jgi:hypothetical protein
VPPHPTIRILDLGELRRLVPVPPHSHRSKRHEELALPLRSGPAAAHCASLTSSRAGLAAAQRVQAAQRATKQELGIGVLVRLGQRIREGPQ